MRKRVFLYLLVLLLFQSNDSIGQDENRNKPASPNIIIFIADDVSVNDIGAYGNPYVQTPNIDYLAKNGMKFNNAILTTSSCSPSRISIITGRYPHNTGAAELHTQPEINFESIASKLKDNGYYTGQAGKWHMGELLKNGFNQIFEVGNGDGGEDMWIPSLEKRVRNKPFFFWFASHDAHRGWSENQFSGTHDPEEIEVPPTLIDNDSSRIDLARYYDEIKRLDFHIGEVIKELKRQNVFDNTVLIVMADNGRPFPRDKTRMYDSGMKTPFIIHWPEGIKSGSVSNSLISSIDIAPTILEICGFDIPESFQGKSFKKLFDNPQLEVRRYAFAEHNWHDHEAHERMVRTTDFLYILNSRPHLPNQGPADAINSSSFRSLLRARDKHKLTSVQSDIFLVPRPREDLYDLRNDVLQTDNKLKDDFNPETDQISNFSVIRDKLHKKLLKWMEKTGDNIPHKITKDWYTRDTGEKIEQNFGKRGEMPGEDEGAEHLNVKD